MCGGESPYRDIVRLLRVGRDGDQHASDAPEHVDERPPGEVGELVVDVAYDGGDEGDEPCELDFLLVFCISIDAGSGGTYNGDTDGGQREGIADDPRDAEAWFCAVSVHCGGCMWNVKSVRGKLRKSRRIHDSEERVCFDLRSGRVRVRVRVRFI